MKLESIEHAKFRAQAQLVLDKEKGAEAFEDYMKIAFPYAESAKQRDRDEYIKHLNDEISTGAIQITSVEEPKMKSRMKTKMMQRNTPQTPNEANDLYKKIGSTIPDAHR